MVLLLGRILFQLGDKAVGEEKISQSIKLFLNAGELESVMREFLFVAQSHHRNGEINEAEAFYRQIMVHVPGEVRAIKGLVSVAETRKDRVGQIDNLLLLGRTMQQGGDRGEAINAFRKVSELDPLNEEAKTYLEGTRSDETSAELSEAQSIATEEDVLDADLEEIEDLVLLDTEEIELEDISPDAMVDDIEEEIEVVEAQEEEFTFDDEVAQVEIVEDEIDDEAIPDIVLEDIGEDFEDDEDLMEISGDAAEDPGDAPEPAGLVEDQVLEDIDLEPVEMSLEELLAEADVYERYGLVDKAGQTLEKAKAMAPDDRNVINRIAAFESGIQAEAVTQAEADLASEKEVAPEFQEIKDPGHDSFGEDLEEADFYHSQGLDDEASRIYRTILERDPHHKRASQALASIEGIGETQPGPAEPELPVETTLESQFDPASAMEVKSKLIVEDSAPEDMGGFFDIADELRTELADELDGEAELGGADGPVSFEEIFSQFKKGIEETLGDEEYETHYNLGIAYKDMGLYDDAIREFESGTRDPELAQDSFSLMAMCYVEKKEYESAVKAIEQALEVSTQDTRTGLFYQLGEVRERQKLWSEAVDAYEQVQSNDPTFERIGEAILRVKASFSDDAPEEDPNELSVGGEMDDMLTDLIREVEEMARESSDETQDDPGKSKKDRISYL